MPKFLSDGHFVGSSTDLTIDGQTTSTKVNINQAADEQGLEIKGYDDHSSSDIKLQINSSGHARLSQTTDGSSGYLFLQAQNYLQLIAGTFTYTTSPIRIYDDTQIQFGSGGDYHLSYNSSADELRLMEASTGTKGLKMDTDGKVTLTENLTVNGDVIGDKFILNDGFQISSSGTYGVFNNWVNVDSTGFYTTTNIFMDLDDSSSRFVVRGVGNTEIFEIDTSDSNSSKFSYPVKINAESLYGLTSTSATNPKTELGGFITVPGAETSRMTYLTGVSENKLGGLYRKGSSAGYSLTSSKDGSTITANWLENAFQANDNFSSLSNTTSSTVLIIEITVPTMFHGSNAGIAFSNGSWRAKDVKIEIYNGTSWSTIYDVTNSNRSTHINYFSKGSTGVTKLKYTLTNFATTSCRISSIFANNYTGGNGVNSQLYANNYLYGDQYIQDSYNFFIPSYVYHLNDTNTYFGFEGNDQFRVVVGGSEKLHVNTSRIRVNDDIEVAADSTYNIGTSTVKHANIHADYFHGDGSNLTNLPSGSTTTINNNADNRVITGSGTADTLEAESGLTFDGDILEITGSGTTTKRMKVSPGTDYGRAHIGRAALGKLGFDDHAGFAHEDHNSQNNYAILQNESGKTFINSASGQETNFRINNSTIGKYNSNGLYFPIYYDSDNTGYYLNPAASSKMVYLGLATDPNTSGSYRLNMGGSIDMNNNSIDYLQQIHFNDNVRFYDNGNDSDLNFKFGDTGYGQIRFLDGDGNFEGSVYTESGYFGTLSNDGTWAVQSANSFTNIAHEVRSPKFIDFDDTTYYLDPAGNSVLNQISFGVPALGGNTKARFFSIEGNADTSGEGSGRIFFTEHNSTDASKSSYGMSLGYRGGNTSITGTDGNSWTGLQLISNGQWGMWGHDGNAQGALIMYGDRGGTFVNFDANALNNTGDITGKSVNNAYSQLYKFGGLFLTWDSDSYGTNFNHSITSTDNGSYSDSITINSYDKVRINIDSNANDSASTFSIGRETTGTANTLLTLEESGNLTIHSGSVAVGSNTVINTARQGFFASLQHSGTISFLNGSQGTTGSGAQGINVGAVFASGSYNNTPGVGDVWAVSDMRAPIFYDYDDTSYYLDPNNTGTSLNVAGKITLPDNKPVEWPNGSIRAEGNTLKLVATTLIDLQDNTQVQGVLTVTEEATNLLTLTNETNGGGAGIVFNDNNGGAQRIYLRGYHADGSSQGGGASLHLQSTEADLVFVVGDSSNSGRIAVKSHNQNGEVDYGFYSDTNTGMYSPAAGQVGLVSDSSRKLLVNNNGVYIQNGNLYIPDHSLYVGNYIYHDGDTNTHIYFASDRQVYTAGGTTMLQMNKNYYGNRYTGLETGIGLHSENLGGANLIKKGTDIAVNTGYREEVTGPDGNRKVQAHVSTGSGTGSNPSQCYQWYSSENVVVNPEKDYEFSVWVKSEGDHNLYLGWHEYNSSGTQISSNPYFHTSTIDTSSVRNLNGWVLLKYQLKSHRTTSGQADTEGTDRYASNGNSSNFQPSGATGVMHSTTKLVHIRMGTCYGNTNTTKSYFYNPKITEAQHEEFQWTSSVARGFASESFRAPVFYDNNNTNYYLDPSSTGTSIKLNGNIEIGGSHTIKNDSNGHLDIRTNTSGKQIFIKANSSLRLDSGGLKALTLDTSQNATFEESVTITGDLDVQGSGITLVDSISFSGTGRIQGIDTVSAATDAASKGYVDGLASNYAAASHNHDDRYYTETESRNKFTTTDATEHDYTFTLDDESNFTGNRWYHLATLNSQNGGLHIRGAILNHVENFASQKIDIAIQVREANDGGQLEITGSLDVLHNETSGTDRAGIRVIKTADNVTYDEFKVYLRVTRYQQVTLRMTEQGTTAFNTNHSSPATSEPAPVSGGHVELDTSSTPEGNYVIDNSEIKEIYHEGHKPTYAELGTMAYSNLTGTPTIPTDFVSAASGGTFSDDITIDGGTSTTLSVKCDNGGNAMVRVNGDGQGTGIVEVGQSNDYGGGMSYNGDGSPSFVSGETADHITFYRLDNGTRTEVFHYPYNSSTVNFNATPTIGGVNIAKISDVPTNNNQLTNGAGYITTDTNYYLDGISKSGNTLTFSVNGATNQTYTFGSNAFNSTTIPTNTNQLTNGAGFITTSATVDHANNLNATDDRDMAPEDYGYSNDLRIFFSAREGLEDGTSTGSDWQDVLYLNSYSDSSGGSANILAFDKSAGTYIIRHYQAAQSASNWGTPKTLAYTDDLGHKCTFTEDSAAGNDISSRIASGFYETNTPTASEGYPSTTELGSSSWAHLLSSTHSNNSNYYAMQFTGSFFNQSLFHRQTNGSGTTDWLRVAQHKDTTVQSGDWLRADKFYTYNDTTRYVDPANTSLMKNINVYGLIGLNGYGNFGHCNGSGGNMLGFNNSNAAGATLGVNKSGQVYEYEKIFTFKVSGSGWVNRYSNPFKLIQAPGADKMIIVDEFLVYIDYETRTGLGGTGIAHGGHTNAYSVGFYESESGQSQSTAANGTSGTFYTLGVMPRNFMATTLDRGYYRDVPVHQSALIANRSLFFRTAQNCGSSGNAPGGAHYIKIKYRVVDISDEFSDSGVDYTLSSSSYHGQYAHSADGNKQYNDNGSANC